MTRLELVPHYADLIKRKATDAEIVKFNNAILSKFKPSGLEYIKVKAWRSLGYKAW